MNLCHEECTTEIYHRKGYKLSKETSIHYYVEWKTRYH